MKECCGNYNIRWFDYAGQFRDPEIIMGGRVIREKMYVPWRLLKFWG